MNQSNSLRMFRKIQRLGFAGLALALMVASNSQAALQANVSPTIDKLLSVHVIQTAEDDGSNPAADLGTASQQSTILDNIDTIYAPAGVDVAFDFAEMTYNNTFALRGEPKDSDEKRPPSDLGTIFSQAGNDGVLDQDPNVVNLFLVDIAPAFKGGGTNTTSGYSYINASGVTIQVGSALPTFSGGRTVQARLIAHELGHNLGLGHVSAKNNLLHTPVKGQSLNSTQIEELRSSDLLTAVPEPGTLALFVVSGMLLFRRTGSWPGNR